MDELLKIIGSLYIVKKLTLKLGNWKLLLFILASMVLFTYICETIMKG